MKSNYLAPLFALGILSAVVSQAQVLMLDFGPTTTTTPANSPYGTGAGASPVWNQVQLADVAAGGLQYATGSTATGVILNLGTATTTTTLNLGTNPGTSNVLGGILNTGIYATGSVGTDAIYSGTNSVLNTTGFQVSGLAAGNYDIYITARNTSRDDATSGYGQVVKLGTSTTSGNFDYNAYSSKTLTYAGATSSTAWVENGNYLKMSITLTSGDFLNLAVYGTGGDLRGFLNSVQIVNTSTIPEPSTYALVAGATALGVIGLRRRRS
ncbi:MAG: PEP-CTERM sorting domain-containing protein [Rariglobus sp.]|nr:PEP-CTERM sorting domain-containing protein [Rariglobus sp.]